MRKILSLLLVLSLLLSFVGCADKSEEKSYKTRSYSIPFNYFDTYSSVTTYGDESNANLEKYSKIVEETLDRYHKLFNIHKDYEGVNNIKTINDNAGVSAVKVDEEIINLLEYCKQLYTITSGKTNIMLGSVLKIWHDARTLAKKTDYVLDPEYLPTEAELKEANEHTSINSLIIDREASTVYISDPKASIDVGAVAKGYTVDILYDLLVKEGADSVVLNIGGNVRTIGLRPDGSKWKSGITNPNMQSADTLACRLNIGSKSIVTSGDYERAFLSGDVKYHHIIDPVTLVPARYFSSVSIITDSSALGDALSTALFCMSYEDGLKLVESIEGVEVIWIDLHYRLETTPGIELID